MAAERPSSMARPTLAVTRLELSPSTATCRPIALTIPSATTWAWSTSV